MVTASAIRAIAASQGHTVSHDDAIDMVACVIKRMDKGNGLLEAVLACLFD